MLKRMGITVAAMVLATFIAASAAQAQQVGHSNFTFSESNDFPTGRVCDFNLRQEFTATVHSTDFGDPDEPGKEIAEASLSLNDINLDTGSIVSESDHTVTSSQPAIQLRVSPSLVGQAAGLVTGTGPDLLEMAARSLAVLHVSVTGTGPDLVQVADYA